MTSAFILADHREDNGAIPYLEAKTEANNRKYSGKPINSGGGTLKYQVLNNSTVGDYIIILPSKYDPEVKIVAAIFERKTWKDLAASIKDQRAVRQHSQMENMRNKKGCFLYYIIEGNLSYAPDTEIARVPFNKLHAKIRCMSLRGVHSFQTKNQMETADILINLARDLSRLYRQGEISFPKQEAQIAETNSLKQQLLHLIESNTENSSDPLFNKLRELIETQEPVSGGTVERDIIPEFTERPERENSDVLLDMWLCLPKVTNISAPILMSAIRLKRLLLADPEEQKSIVAELAVLKYASGTSFGTARAKSLVSNTVNIHPLILSKIPGITLDTAKKILAEYPLPRLLRSEITEEQLAEIQKSGTRKVGPVVARKILSVFDEF